MAALASIEMKAWHAVGRPFYTPEKHLERFKELCEDICGDEIGVRLVCDEMDDVMSIGIEGYTGIALEAELVWLATERLREQLHVKLSVWESMHGKR